MAPMKKKVVQFEIKSNGELFHELWKAKPYQMPDLTPTTIQNCQVQAGQVGTVGSILLWNYTLDGKGCIAKTLIKDINATKKSLTLEVIEGDLSELYKPFVLTIQVDKHGSNSLVTYTTEYEKVNPGVLDPNTLMELFKKMTKDIEAAHLQIINDHENVNQNHIHHQYMVTSSK